MQWASLPKILKKIKLRTVSKVFLSPLRLYDYQGTGNPDPSMSLAIAVSGIEA